MNQVVSEHKVLRILSPHLENASGVEILSCYGREIFVQVNIFLGDLFLREYFFQGNFVLGVNVFRGICISEEYCVPVR